MGFKGYDAQRLEDALGTLWELVEDCLSEEEKVKLVKDEREAMGKKDLPKNYVCGIFDELIHFGKGGPVGIGLGRCGGHAVGE